MKITLDASKNAQENAADYYSRASKHKAKADGARKALENTLKEIEREKRREQYAGPVEPPAKKKARIRRELEWFERYRWFYTSSGLLVIAGRDASQNELIVSRHGEKGDLFFHADVHGAPATILKGGDEKAGQQDRKEAAQFAVSYSSAWKNGAGSADTYCVPIDQVSKQAKAGEYVAKGGFIIKGKREYFKNTELGLAIGIDEKKRIVALPQTCQRPLEKKVRISPGNVEKGEIAKKISVQLGEGNLDEILLVLPAGKTSIVR